MNFALPPYTVALTSCGRFDLLANTLSSLLPKLEGPVKRVLVCEDSGNSAVVETIRQFDSSNIKIELIINEQPIGQTKSIDKLYSLIDTDWVFHCEDDWEFFSTGFISRSMSLLLEIEWLSMVSPRDRTLFHPKYFKQCVISEAGVRHYVADPLYAKSFSGLWFSPGMRRMRDYKIVGPYNLLGIATAEERVAKVYHDLGYRVAILAEPAVRHTGDNRHVPNSTKLASFRHKMMRSTGKRLERFRWMLLPHTEPVNRARQRKMLFDHNTDD